jgi:hypothetical protein
MSLVLISISKYNVEEDGHRRREDRRAERTGEETRHKMRREENRRDTK